MEKLSLERFREIKKIMQDISKEIMQQEITQERFEEIAPIYKAISEELKSHDLSDIDFEEYRGFDISLMELEGTGANLDFSILECNDKKIGCLKGCNIRNFDFSLKYTEDDFDSEFIEENKDKFWGLDIPDPAVRRRYYNNALTFADLKKYNLYDKADSSHFEYDVKTMINEYGMEIFKYIDLALLETSEFIFLVNELPGKVKKVVEEANENGTPVDEDKIKELEKEYILSGISNEYDYERIRNNPKIKALVEDEFIEFSEEEKYLKNRFIGHQLLFDDIVSNYSIFREKNFLFGMSNVVNETMISKNLTKENLNFFIENFTDIAKLIASTDYDGFLEIVEVVDMNASKEDNLENIYSKLEDILKKIALSWDLQSSINNFCQILPFSRCYPIAIADDYTKGSLHKILSYSSDEKIKSYNIPIEVFRDHTKVNLFYTFGIDTMMEFDRENSGIFSGVNFENLKDFYDYYIHYDGNNFNLETSLQATKDYSDDDMDRPYTKEEFEETIFRAIMYGPTDGNTKGRAGFDFDCFSKEFSQKYLDYYLNKKFKDSEQKEKIKKVFSKYNLKYIESFLIDRKVIEWRKSIIDDYDAVPLEDLDIENLTEEELDNLIISKARNGMITGYIDFSENEPDIIKEKIPEFFLDQNAPEELKQKFYRSRSNEDIFHSYEFSFDDFSNEEYWPYLKGKSIEASNYEEELGIFIKKFSLDEIIHFVNEGYEGLDESKFEQYKEVLAVCIGDTKEHIPEIEDGDLLKIQKFLSKYPLRYISQLTYYDINQCFYENCEEKVEEPKLKVWFKFRMMDLLEDRSLDYSEKDRKFLEEFFPDFFLDEDAPEELKQKFYTKLHGNFEMTDLNNLEFQKYLEGKSISWARKTQELTKLLKRFPLKKLFEFANLEIDDVKTTVISENGEKVSRDEAEIEKEKENLRDRNINILNFYGCSESNVDALWSIFILTTNKIAQRELRKKYNLPDDVDFELQGIHLEELSEREEKIKKDLFLCPGLVLYLDQEELENAKISEYNEIRRLSRFHLSPNYRLDLAEQILGKMYGFLGYGNCRSVFELPQLSEEALDELIVQNGELTKDLYEEKYKIVGSVDIASNFFVGLSNITSEGKKKSKEFWNIAKSINQKISNGFDGNIEELINTCCIENNCEITDEVIQEFFQKMKTYHTKYKKEIASEHIAYMVNDIIRLENTETRKKLKNFVIDAIEESLITNEKIDLKTIRAYLEKEFSAKNEDGTPAYSNHITDHLEDLVKIAEELSKSKDFGEILNKSVVDVLKEEQQKIGQGWIRKLLKVDDFPEKLTVDEYNELEELLYGNKGIEIETKMVIGPKDTSAKGLEKAFELLADSGFEAVLTFEKAEIMFNALNKPYSEEFKNFFMRNKDKFISIPEFYTEFTRLHKYFESIISDRYISNRYKKGDFSVEEAVKELKKSSFRNIEDGEYGLAFAGRKGKHWDQEKFERAKQIFKEMKEREFQAIPPEEVQNGRFRGRILRIDDPLALVIGDITTCCQVLEEGQPGESSMMHSVTEHNGSLFIVEELNENGEPIREVAQSWMWRNGDRICFDNIEIPDPIIPELGKQKAFDNILDVYIEEAKKIIETDNKALKKLLEVGVITEQEYDSMMISEITAGTGCDNLISNISKERREKLQKADIIVPIENSKTYTGMHSRSLYSDARYDQLVFVKNPSKVKSEHKDISVSDKGLKYTKIRDIIRRDGEDINPDLIKLIKKMNAQENNPWEEIENYIDILSTFAGYNEYYGQNIDDYRMDLSISEAGDWYILTQTDNNLISVNDSFISTNFDENNPKSKFDKKMSVYEYTQELLNMFSRNFGTENKVQIDLEREGKFATLDAFIQTNIISVSDDGIVTVKDIEKLRDAIKSIDEQYKKLRTERMLSDIGREDER